MNEYSSRVSRRDWARPSRFWTAARCLVSGPRAHATTAFFCSSSSGSASSGGIEPASIRSITWNHISASRASRSSDRGPDRSSFASGESPLWHPTHRAASTGITAFSNADDAISAPAVALTAAMLTDMSRINRMIEISVRSGSKPRAVRKQVQ